MKAIASIDRQDCLLSCVSRMHVSRTQKGLCSTVQWHKTKRKRTSMFATKEDFDGKGRHVGQVHKKSSRTRTKERTYDGIRMKNHKIKVM